MVVLEQKAVRQGSKWETLNVLRFTSMQVFLKQDYSDLARIKGDMSSTPGQGVKEFRGVLWNRNFYSSNLMIF